jgi:hypothetical protein
MIDMRVTQDNCVDSLYIEREGFAIQFMLSAATLYKATVEQNTGIAGLHQMAGSRHPSGSTQALDMHQQPRL